MRASPAALTCTLGPTLRRIDAEVLAHICPLLVQLADAPDAVRPPGASA
ncbi:hypothetical protein [Nocardia sp. NPDC046763]